MIAELGFDEAMELRNVKSTAFAGGVSLDPERFAAFGKLTGSNPSLKWFPRKE